MASEREPTMRAAWLGVELRTLREAHKIEGKDIAGYLGKSQSTISRVESGLYPANEEQVRAYLDICGANDSHGRKLLEMCEDVGRRGWWDGYSGDVAGTLMNRTWIEARASDIQTCDITYFPGLLQTPEYARALFEIGTPDAPKRELERWLEFRMTRQLIVTRHHPVNLHCVIDEYLFDRVTGDTTVMANQMSYLLEVCQRPNVTIRVLPAGTDYGVNGPFEVMKLVKPYPRVGYVATSAGDICVETPDLDALEQTYDRLLKVALSPAASEKLIKTKRKNL